MRLFWAVNLPPHLKAALANIQGLLKKTNIDVKWVEENNFHLTVQFLGEVEPSLVTYIITVVEKALEEVEITPFSILLKGVGFFPDQTRPRVLWVGVEGEVDKLVSLQKQVCQAMSPLGFPLDKKAFSPHLTIARFRSSREINELLRKIKQLRLAESLVGEIKVNSLELMQSELSRQGPMYSVITSIPLHDFTVKNLFS